MEYLGELLEELEEEEAFSIDGGSTIVMMLIRPPDAPRIPKAGCQSCQQSNYCKGTKAFNDNLLMGWLNYSVY